MHAHYRRSTKVHVRAHTHTHTHTHRAHAHLKCLHAHTWARTHRHMYRTDMGSCRTPQKIFCFCIPASTPHPGNIYFTPIPQGFCTTNPSKIHGHHLQDSLQCNEQFKVYSAQAQSVSHLGAMFTGPSVSPPPPPSPNSFIITAALPAALLIAALLAAAVFLTASDGPACAGLPC